MLAIIEAYVGTLPDDMKWLHILLYDVMILTERPEFDEIDDDDEYVSDDDVNEEVSSDAAAHFGPFE